MMRRDTNGVVDGEGIKQGKAVETGVTLIAPIVIGAAITPKVAPETIKSLGGIPEAEAVATQTVANTSRSTGARELSAYDFNGAEKVYSEIQASKTDVSAIAKNTGINEYKIQRIKDHLFNRLHKLDDGLRRFDADPEIANAWKRLETGNHTPNDLKLLEHEYFESKFENLFKTDYRKAHDAANRSGRKSGLE